MKAKIALLIICILVAIVSTETYKIHFDAFINKYFKETENTHTKKYKRERSRHKGGDQKSKENILVQSVSVVDYDDTSEQYDTLYFDSGEIQYVFNMENNQRNGYAKEFSKTGRVVALWSYRNGTLHGDSHFYLDGGEFSVETYKDDTIIDEKLFYPDSSLQETYAYRNGKRDGETKRYYRSGEVEAEWIYNRGEIVEGKGYFKSQALKYVYNYSDGMLQGVTKEFNEAGQLVTEWNYEDNKVHGRVVEYYKAGTPRLEWIYARGETVGGKGFYEDGSTMYRYTFKDGLRDGPVTEYYKTGEVSCKWLYKKDKLSGITKEFYRDGSLKATWKYFNNQLNGYSRTFDAHGKETGKFYYLNGKLTKK